MKTCVNRIPAIALALAGTAPPAGAVMVDSFVDGADFGLESILGDGCNPYGSSCPPARMDFAVGIIDLGHPSLTPFTHDAIVGFGGTGDRNLVFDATRTFAVDSIGIRFEPLAGGATSLQVDIHAVSLTGGVGTRGALLATARTAISANGVDFYDVPIDFWFAAGQRHDVGLLPVAPETWGNSDRNSMAFYQFDYPQAAYEVGGVLSVIDGGQSDAQDGTGGGYSNFVMPHLRFSIVASPIPVPLPGTLILLGLGLPALGVVRKRRR